MSIRGSTASRCLNREATGGEEKKVREGGQVPFLRRQVEHAQLVASCEEVNLEDLTAPDAHAHIDMHT